MANTLKLFLLFIAATVLHWAFMSVFGGAGVSLNVMLVFACAVCAYLPPQYGYTAAFVCGLFLDFFGVKLFGNNALTFTLCACMMYGLDKRLDFDAPAPLLRVFAGFSAWTGFWPLLSGVVFNAVLSPFVFWAVRRVFKRER